jgi:hypothetical protein
MAGRRYGFRIGDVFDAEDPIARWLIVLSMGLNDVVYVTKRLTEQLQGDAPPYANIYEIRLAALHFWELSKFLRESIGSSAEIRAFVDALPQQARDDLDAALASTDTANPHGFKGNFGSARDQFSHYAEVDNKLLRRALKAVADHESELNVGEQFGDFRAGYADEVAGQLFFSVPGEDVTDLKTFVEQLRDGSAALMRFVQTGPRPAPARPARRDAEVAVSADHSMANFAGAILRQAYDAVFRRTRAIAAALARRETRPDVLRGGAWRFFALPRILGDVLLVRFDRASECVYRNDRSQT